MNLWKFTKKCCRTDDAYAKLDDLCPTEELENLMNKAISSGNFDDLMTESKRALEDHGDYKNRFKQALSRRLTELTGSNWWIKLFCFCYNSSLRKLNYFYILGITFKKKNKVEVFFFI